MTKRLTHSARNDIPVSLTVCSSENELIDVLNDFTNRHGFALLSILEADKTSESVRQLITIPQTTVLDFYEDFAFNFFSEETFEFTRTAYHKSLSKFSLPAFKNRLTIRSFYIAPFPQDEDTVLLLAIAHQKRNGIYKFGLKGLNYFSSAVFATLYRLKHQKKLTNYFESRKVFARSIDRICLSGGIESNFEEILESFKRVLNNNIKGTVLWLYNKTQVGEELVLRYATDIPTDAWKHTYIGLNDSCTGVAIKELRTKYFQNIQMGGLFKNPEVAAKYNLKQLIAIPLVTSEKTVHGAINIYPSDDFIPDSEVIRMINLNAVSVAKAFESIEMRDKLRTLNNVISFHKKAEPFTSLDKFFETVVLSLKDPNILGVQGASVFFSFPYRNALFLHATTGLEKLHKNRDVIYEYGEGLTGRVAQTGKTIIVHNLEKEKGLVRGKAVERTDDPGKTWIGTPIVAINTGKVIGVIRCVNKIKRENSPFMEFSFLDQRVLEFIAFFSSMVIQYIKMIEDKEKILNFQAEFINSLSHEIDSPITGILGRIDLIRKYWEHEDVTKEKRTLWIRDVQNECDHIDFLVRRYSLKGPQYKEINLVKEVVIPIRYLLAPVAQKTKYIAIIHDIEEEIPNVIVDVHRFKQVFYNLIINAIKYSRRNTDITIVLRNFKGSIIIEISNFGIGIQKGWQEKIFTEYVRAPGAKKFHPSGTGRGLHTCKTIVADEHGGKIWLGKHTNPTVFKVSIPSHRVCLSRR